MLEKPNNYRILVVDDEPDIHTLSKLTLKKIRFNGKRVKIVNAMSAKEAIQIMREYDNIAVILLDVVMETEDAGLQACRAIREDLENHFVRIFLRTGQPGKAPEMTVIDDYDIDGYLAKAELTTERLYTAVRTALKAFNELIDLEVHRHMQQQIEHERHQAIANMVTGVAHEINTPLGIITSATSVIKQTLQEDVFDVFCKQANEQTDVKALMADINESITLIQANVARTNQLVRNFKKISCQQMTDSQETVDIIETIEDTLILFKISNRECQFKCQFECLFEHNIPAADNQWYGYPGYLTQIILDCLNNIATHAYPNKKGEIHLSLKVNEKNYFQLDIEDKGQGIADSALAHLYDAFYTTARNQGKTGLGLTIVHNLMTKVLIGKITIISKEGEGTTVQLKFPKNISKKD